MNPLKQLEFELEIHETIHATPIRFCGKFVTTLKMAHYMKIDKIKSFLNTKSYPFQPKVSAMTYIFT